MIEINHLNLAFGQGEKRNQVLDDVNISVKEGEIYGLVGESGSGKTTVLKCLAGLFTHWDGELSIDGRPLEKRISRERCRRVQMVFQDPYGSLHPRHTIGDILEEPLQIHGIGDRERRIYTLLDKVGLNRAFRDRYPHQLSGGQRQRVAIARALILEPQVLLLDDVVKPLQDELETMLAQRQQRLLLTDIENETVVSGDATLIRVILRNLVENAHRYSPEGSTIRVSVKAGLMPVMAVEDEGPGIDEAKSGELSKAFVRMDSRYGGIGLGLSIVTRIAQLHDAQFFLHNRQPGPGVRAWVLFPQRGGQNVSTH